MDQIKLIHEAYADILSPIIPYPSPLPDDLKEWHCYPRDAGHCILVLVKNNFEPDSPNLFHHIVPCPVKAVLKDYYMYQGIPVASVTYSNVLGIEVDEDDYEY